MNIIDLHCDALLKLQEAEGKLRFADGPQLDANLQRLMQGGVAVQCFAIFIDPDIKQEHKFDAALGQIDLFYREVLGRNPDMKHLKHWEDFDTLEKGRVGAFLSLEGVDAIGNDLGKLRILYQLGVRSVGLTWNNANLAADGAGEPRGAGLTSFGKEIVQLNNEHKVLTDVSHLCEKAFWDCLEVAEYPIASHSNSRHLCNHVRNLHDQQASALFEKNGMLHVVFFPDFVVEGGKANVQDVVRHIDRFCALGGVNNLGFGSDFDGISSHVSGLENASLYPNLINELLKHFSEEQVRGFAYQNFLDHRPK
ncbi:diguanylate cyclase [Mesobacillus campisalis]|uniref:Diguanylate cyclase n=1 Tax=Mesobacillus campisalis TaxID=1408103 RepID=A0A0M2SS12_9BACI|nr:dipeptidase [Mesobacillus campisalis]KKK37354.1 diguanylate cyclase [Mesobacillus campisalis]